MDLLRHNLAITNDTFDKVSDCDAMITPTPFARAPRKISATHPTPQNCRQMIPLRSRSDSLTFTPGPHAIGIESNFSRCPPSLSLLARPSYLFHQFRRTSRVLRLTLLAPAIVEAILGGRQPAD